MLAEMIGRQKRSIRIQQSDGQPVPRKPLRFGMDVISSQPVRVRQRQNKSGTQDQVRPLREIGPPFLRVNSQHPNGTKLPWPGYGAPSQEVAMDRVTRCLQCGKRMVPAPSYAGRTELKCVFCDKLDPMEMAEPNKWADSPLATPVSEIVP